MTTTSGDPATAEPGGRAKALRDWMAGAGREAWRHKVASGLIAVGLALAVAAGVIGTPGHTRAAAPRMPGFTLPALGHPGQQVSLASFAGRPIVINFFASWCIPCKKETPLLASFFRRAHGRVVMIGVDVNDPADAALRFVRMAGVTYRVAVDRSAATASAWGVIAIPQTFFLDPGRHVVKRVFGALTLGRLTKDTALVAAISRS